MQRRPRLVWPLILLLVGFLLLCNNLGIITWNVWGMLWQFWPVFLILAGLEILAAQSNSALVHFGAVALGLVVVLALIALSVIGQGVAGIGGATTTRQVSEKLGNIRQAEVTVALNAGDLEVSALGDGDALIQGTLEGAGSQVNTVQQDYTVSGSRGTFSLQNSDRGTFVVPFAGNRVQRWQLALTSQVPLDLRFTTGAGESRLDLRRLKVPTLRLNTGVGNTTVTLPAEGQVQAEVDGGVGGLTIEVPQGTPARIDVSTGIGRTNVDQSRFRPAGDHVYQTDNYDAAESRIDLRIRAGVGTITVQ